MTMMVHYIGVLPRGIELESLGEDWKTHVEDLREVRLEPWHGAPDWLRDGKHKRADWGTMLYELAASDVTRLTGMPSQPGRYVAAWVECY